MDRMLFLAMTAAKHIEWQQATTANNLANIHTNGFKAEQVSFRALPVLGDGAATRSYVVDNTVGHDTSPGSLNETGNPNDFALATAGFFAVQAPDGSEAYTRHGGYVLDETGTMRTQSGLPILSDGGPIVIPSGYRVQIHNDGTVFANPQTGSNTDPQQIAQIKLVNPEAKQVYKGPDGLFRLNGNLPAGTDANVRIRTGMLEASNVNAVESLVQMISHGRMFELNLKLMSTAEQNAQQATQLLSLS